MEGGACKKRLAEFSGGGQERGEGEWATLVLLMLWSVAVSRVER